MIPRRWLPAGGILLALVLSATAPAAEAPAAHIVKRDTFVAELEATGVFVPDRMHEIALHPKAWNELLVLDAIEAGRRVEKGEVILRLDAEKLVEAIEDLEASIPLAEVSLKLAREELAALKETAPLDLDAAQRARQRAEQDLERYQETGRPLAVKSARFDLKRAEQRLKYQKEELRQLEKMYKADDLTEETEEIVLERQRNAVEHAAFALDVAKENTEKTLKIDLPRQDVDIRNNARRQAIETEKAKAALPAALEKKRHEVQQQTRGLEKNREKLADLKSDLESMVVRAPTDGIVYYGPCVRGEWPKLSRTLDRGTKLGPHEAVLTVVEPRPIRFRAVVSEKELHRLKPGLAGQVKPTAHPDAAFGAQLQAISAIPVSSGKFALTAAVDVGEEAPWLVPGMTGKMVLATYRAENALVAPAAAVFGDEPAGPNHVYLKTARGHKKQPVKVGHRTKKQVEILEGLKEGDEILAEKPKDAK
jgi:multidrug resistance efflux pump